MALISTQEILEPPSPPKTIKDFSVLNKYLTQVYNFDYIVWKRIGGYSADDPGYKNMVFQNSNNIAITGGTLENVTIEASSINGGFIELASLSSCTITNSTIDNTPITDSNLTDCPTNQGDSSSFIKLGGNAYTNTNSQGNVGAALTDMLQYSQPSDSMNIDGSYIEIEGWGIFAANGNNKRIVLYFGSTVLLDTGILAANAGSWIINATVIRTSSSAQKAIVKIVSSNALIVASTSIATPAENTANSIIVKFASQGIANNDIVQEGLTIKYYNK